MCDCNQSMVCICMYSLPNVRRIFQRLCGLPNISVWAAFVGMPPAAPALHYHGIKVDATRKLHTHYIWSILLSQMETAFLQFIRTHLSDASYVWSKWLSPFVSYFHWLRYLYPALSLAAQPAQAYCPQTIA